ncbi:MAG: hypothetical protein QM765_41950 [Myxococcales bacterium]
MHAEVLRTDLDGEVVLHSDGEKVTYATEKGGGLAQLEQKTAETVEPAEPPRPEPKKTTPAKVTPAPPTPEPTPVPAPTPPSKTKTIVVTGDEGGGGGSERPASAGGYVASKNSEVFHRPECNNAQRIKPGNVVRFRTREEATASKRPAKDCNP